ncbi:MAG: putative 4-hydroxybenzoate polyprenyltransferase [Candidatus Marinimicrobia bacterium]|nr:putative 4-hydroxybenzoate polyprenyltransferase [Candidatus Neomarinimicrobiota bacterium]MDD5582343.1 putative 4-hydroxybenzoate polyprenyltransferase [Candidatus Neomarinimicrobiota bacterium]
MKILDYGRMIKFSHSLFALPFALASFVLAVDFFEIPSKIWMIKLLWILVAMVSARSAAMGFNRIVDRHLDAMNPRTKDRELPKGVLRLSSVVLFVVLSALLFLFSAGMLNRLCFWLAFPVLAILLGYSYLKRVWAGTHFILGLSLAIAPSGVWLALTEKLTLIPILLSLAVMVWTAGFDILYAIQDVTFDRKHHLHSIPADMSVEKAIDISRLCHGLMVVFLILLHSILPAHWILWLGTCLIAFLIFYEHFLVFRSYKNINKAFFNMNSTISVMYFAFVLLDRMLL